MRKKCKRINITDWRTAKPWVTDCVMRHKKRYDFKALLMRHGLSEADYCAALDNHDYSIFEDAIVSISKDACERIANRELNLKPVHIRIMLDTTTGKERQIGKESAMQQIFDHIAVGSSQEIFNSRMVSQQMSSIKGRGQIKGIKLIRRYIQKDNDAFRYAMTHDGARRYSRKCRYHVKLDIKKCYPSADIEIFMKLFEHDCGNKDIIWLWRTLLASHHVDGYNGFMIGALPSQWACQIMLSFIYRKAMELYCVRRNKRMKKVTHMVMFMDDMLLFGANRKQLRSAVNELVKYTKDELGFTIKPNYEIKDIDIEPVDMMGYTIFGNEKIRMRDRNFIHSRRLMGRFVRTGKLVLSQAKRLISYKGFWKYSDTKKATELYKPFIIFDKCAKIISKYDKENKNAKSKIHGRTRSDCIFITG